MVDWGVTVSVSAHLPAKTHRDVDSDWMWSIHTLSTSLGQYGADEIGDLNGLRTPERLNP